MSTSRADSITYKTNAITFHYSAEHNSFYKFNLNDMDYTFAEKLGSGKYKTVYRFIPFMDGSPELVLKIQTKIKNLKDTLRTRKYEIETSQLVNPHIAKKYFALEHIKIPGYDCSECVVSIEPYCPGKTLAEYLKSHQSHTELLEVFLAVAEKLLNLHDLGIIHGDIKDDNIIIEQCPITNRMTVHIIDFDCSYKITDRHATKTRTTAAELGKHHHWAPERLGDNKEPLSPAFNQDIYSFGRLLETTALRIHKHLPTKLTAISREILYARTATERPSLTNIIGDIKEALRPASPNTTTSRLIQKGISKASRWGRDSKDDSVTPPSFSPNTSSSTSPLIKLSISNRITSSPSSYIFNPFKKISLHNASRSPSPDTTQDNLKYQKKSTPTTSKMI